MQLFYHTCAGLGVCGFRFWTSVGWESDWSAVSDSVPQSEAALWHDSR